MFGLAGLLRAPPTKQDLVCAVQTVLSRAFAFTELDTHASASMDSAVPTTHGRNEDLGQDKSRGKRLAFSELSAATSICLLPLIGCAHGPEALRVQPVCHYASELIGRAHRVLLRVVFMRCLLALTVLACPHMPSSYSTSPLLVHPQIRPTTTPRLGIHRF